MLWPIKISFRPSPDKELTKEIKFDPNLTVLNLLLKSCEIFEIKDKHNYALIHKKIILPPFESLIEAKLAQGSTVTIIKNIKPRENRDVLFNYKIIDDSKIMKSLGRYSSDELFCNCLKMVPCNSENLNSLKHPSKLPLISILSAKLCAADIMDISEFTLNSLGLKGNYSVMINYHESSEYSKFVDFFSISCFAGPKHQIPSKDLTNELPHKLQCVDTLNDVAVNPPRSETLEGDEINFKIFRPVHKNVDAPDVPDSFYDLTSNELLEFQKSLQKTTKSLIDRPLVSAKLRHQLTPLVRDNVDIKLIFPDQVQVRVNFSSKALNFINSRIFHSPINDIELWIGPPYKLLNDLGKTLYESGIVGPTRVIVKCDEYSYRQDLNIENK